MRPPKFLRIFFSEEKRLKWAIADFRREMAWFGYPLDDLTDQEVLDSVVKVAGIMSGFGISVKQAGEAMRKLSAASLPQNDVVGEAILRGLREDESPE